MSFLHLKNKTEPKYEEPQTVTLHKNIFTSKLKPENIKEENSKSSSMMIGENVTITGKIKGNEVTIFGTIDGDIDCNKITIEKTGNVKGKITVNTLCIMGKAEGEVNVSALLNIKSEGSLNGKVFYGEIEVEEGGKISGEIHHRDKDNNKQEEFKKLKSLS